MDEPVSESLLEGLEQSARGDVVSLGSFAEDVKSP